MISEGRNIGQGAIETNIALALLLRVVKRVSVKYGPDELAAYILKTEFEVGVLINGVVAGEKSSRTDRRALLFGDLLGRDQARGIARPGGCNRGIIGVRERVPQSDVRNRLFDGYGRLNFAGAVW